jgi:hypothetical protein
MNNLIGELKEAIGEKLAPIVVDLLKHINVMVGGTSPERAQSQRIRDREISGKGELRLQEFDKKIKDMFNARGAINSATSDLRKLQEKAIAIPGANDRINAEIGRMEKESQKLWDDAHKMIAERPKIAEQAMLEQDDITSGMMKAAADKADKRATEEQAKIKEKANREAEKLQRDNDRVQKQKLRDDIGLAEDRADEIRKQLKGEFGQDPSLSATESRTLTRGTGNINDQERQDRIKQQRTLEAMLKAAEDQKKLLQDLLKKKEVDVNVVGA